MARRAEEERARRQQEEEARAAELHAAAAAAREAAAAALPPEPEVSAETVTVLIRVPTGERQPRRFLRSDPVAALFGFADTLDLGDRHGAYRLASQFPRRVWERPAAGEADAVRTLAEAGLTGKQEALIVEFIAPPEATAN
mmetsp:Transcript_4606/g.13486  ORF Transcript_4606/g.13486 Transcript_4606/m.13486 type:complete len:141 (+) Transcript_4606:1197-1619(+)